MHNELEAEIRLLQDPYERVRHRAAEALGRRADPAALEPLCAALQDESVLVRQSAAYALGAIGDAAAVGPLCAALHDASEHVRLAAAHALGQIGGTRSLPCAVLLTEMLDGAQRWAALDALLKVRYQERNRRTLYHRHALDHDFRDVTQYCEAMLDDPDAGPGAKQVLDRLAGERLLRPGAFEPGSEEHTLVRPAAGEDETPAEELLRAADAPEPPPAHRPSALSRWLRGR